MSTNVDRCSIEIAKTAAGVAAAQFIENGMLVGLGTGSTVKFFLEALGKRCREGLKITAIASSQQTTDQALLLSIPIIDPENVSSVDLTIDGADEIDSKKNMIKGGGGALLREKLVAQSSKKMIVIVDEFKLVESLGSFPVPVEIVSFLYRHTLEVLKSSGYKGSIRLGKDALPYLTDNGNYIFDIHYDSLIKDVIEEHEKLKAFTGVVETGLFYQLASNVIVGYKDGTTKTLT